MTSARRILGVFPGLGYFDGIGRSGLAAWQGICRAPGVDPVLLTYGSTPPPVGRHGKVLHATSPAGTVLNALRCRAGTAITLVWHVHLLRLLRFLPSNGRVVLYLHGIEAWRTLPPALRSQLRRVHLVLSNSDYTWTRFLEHNPEFASLPHKTVALGLDHPLSGPSAPPPDPPLALMIGRISRSEAYKGHHAVISSWAEVRRRIPGAELHIIGPGDLYDELRQLAVRSGVAEFCHLHGSVSQARKEELISASRCMALPSRGEGFGLAYVESMRFGRPCLVSESDAGREVVNPPEAGLAVNPDDPSALTEALCALLTAGPAWETWSQHARARYDALYTEAAFVQRLNAALELL